MRFVLVLKAYHFDRDDVALPGFHQFMLKQSDEERGHAQKVSLLNYVVLENVNHFRLYCCLRLFA